MAVKKIMAEEPSDAEKLAELLKMQKAWSKAKAKKEEADAALKDATETIKRYCELYESILEGKSKNIGGIRIGYSRETTYTVPQDKIPLLYKNWPIAVKFTLSTSGINALLKVEEAAKELTKDYKLKATEEVKFTVSKA